MPVLRHHTVLGQASPKNWFGDESDGDIRITSAGVQQSFDGGVTWQAIPGWTKVGNTIMIPSVQDGDMVVVNAINLILDSDYTLTVANRCRGLTIYCTGNATIDGTLSMTARGCHANPADSSVTSDTPVAPSDGNAVPPGGIAIRRLAEGNNDTNMDTDLFQGCGNAMVNNEINQPEIVGNGIVISVPRVGGKGAVGSTGSGTQSGGPGGTVTNAPGGGGSAARYNTTSAPYGDTSGADATCFSGGPGGGGQYINGSFSDRYAEAGAPFGGPGGHADDVGTGGSKYGGGGAGNPGGPGHLADGSGDTGTGGFLLLIIGGDLSGSGTLQSDGKRGGSSTSGLASGGSSGGGFLAALYAGTYSSSINTHANGGVAKDTGGRGGHGSVVGPLKIDPA